MGGFNLFFFELLSTGTVDTAPSFLFFWVHYLLHTRTQQLNPGPFLSLVFGEISCLASCLVSLVFFALGIVPRQVVSFGALLALLYDLFLLFEGT